MPALADAQAWGTVPAYQTFLPPSTVSGSPWARSATSSADWSDNQYRTLTRNPVLVIPAFAPVCCRYQTLGRLSQDAVLKKISSHWRGRADGSLGEWFLCCRVARQWPPQAEEDDSLGWREWQSRREQHQSPVNVQFISFRIPIILMSYVSVPFSLLMIFKKAN